MILSIILNKVDKILTEQKEIIKAEEDKKAKGNYKKK